MFILLYKSFCFYTSASCCFLCFSKSTAFLEVLFIEHCSFNESSLSTCSLSLLHFFSVLLHEPYCKMILNQDFQGLSMQASICHIALVIAISYLFALNYTYCLYPSFLSNLSSLFVIFWQFSFTTCSHYSFCLTIGFSHYVLLYTSI